MAEQRVKKGLLSTVTVRYATEQKCSDEHACKAGRDETRKPSPVEQTLCSGSEYARLDKSKRNVTRQKKIIKFKPATEGDERDHPAEVTGWRETVQARGNSDWFGRSRWFFQSCHSAFPPTVADALNDPHTCSHSRLASASMFSSR